MALDIRAVVLAAGKGTRLHSDENPMPKVLRMCNGRSLLSWVLEALDFLPPEQTILVAGYKKEAVLDAFPGYAFAVQEPQLGTGHALACAAPLLRDFSGTVLVCCGDMPLLRQETYLGLLRRHTLANAACTVLSGTSDLALAFGRVLRDEAGNFLRVVEERDCTSEEKAIRELNCGVYAFDCRKMLPCLARLRPDNDQKEYYLTDIPALLRQEGETVAVFSCELGEQILGVNTPEQLEAAEAYLRRREAAAAAEAE